MQFTISQFRKKYPNDDVCLSEVMKLRNLKTCPSCKKDARFHRVQGRRCFECSCGFQFYPTKGTPFEKTSTPLSDWFYVIYLMTATRSGVSAMEVKRQLGVTYKTAWRMCSQIRKLMGMERKKLSGAVEVDEATIGGRAKQDRIMANKTILFGAVERKGRIQTAVIPDNSEQTLLVAVRANVEKGSTLLTDKLRAYKNIAHVEGYKHSAVKHSAKEFVRGTTHTNTIDGFFSLFQRSISGTHVHISKKHMQKYVDEFAFRYNHRKEPALMFERLLQNVPRV